MILTVIWALAGLTLLVGGMWLMPKGLETLGRQQIQKAITRFTATPLVATVTGTVITMLVQSSSAVTVITMGLVNGGMMTFTQGLGIVLGTNIGTTFTIQLIALDLKALSPWLISGGLTLWLALPFPQTKALGQAAIGLGLIFYGLTLLGTVFQFQSNSNSILTLLQALGNDYLLAMIAGFLVTGLLQSSSVVLGLTLVLAQQNLLSLPCAVAIMLGSNLGTCITAVLAAIASNLEARRIVLAHVLLNALGALVFFPFVELFAQFLQFTAPDLPRQVANGHTVYNIICSLLALPFIHQFARLIYLLLPER